MARVTYVIRDGELIERRFAPPLHVTADAPMIRPDGMDPVRSMLDGRTYDSRSAYYDSVRRSGCEIVGNERKPFDRRFDYRPHGVAADISRTIDQLQARS